MTHPLLRLSTDRRNPALTDLLTVIGGPAEPLPEVIEARDALRRALNPVDRSTLRWYIKEELGNRGLRQFRESYHEFFEGLEDKMVWGYRSADIQPMVVDGEPVREWWNGQENQEGKQRVEEITQKFYEKFLKNYQDSGHLKGQGSEIDVKEFIDMAYEVEINGKKKYVVDLQLWQECIKFGPDHPIGTTDTKNVTYKIVFDEDGNFEEVMWKDTGDGYIPQAWLDHFAPVPMKPTGALEPQPLVPQDEMCKYVAHYIENSLPDIDKEAKERSDQSGNTVCAEREKLRQEYEASGTVYLRKVEMKMGTDCNDCDGTVSAGVYRIVNPAKDEVYTLDTIAIHYLAEHGTTAYNGTECGGRQIIGTVNLMELIDYLGLEALPIVD